ncbi:hypothetical protein ABNF65_02750 [Paenibacillus larvae]|nr:hypothetical protein [Paenibacillus phage SV21]
MIHVSRHMSKQELYQKLVQAVEALPFEYKGNYKAVYAKTFYVRTTKAEIMESLQEINKIMEKLQKGD